MSSDGGEAREFGARELGLKTVVSSVAASLLMAAPIGAVEANAPPKPTSRAEATAVVRELRRIVTPNGVDLQQLVRIGGIDQAVSIRGRDRRNPLLLVLHGGPGFPETPLAWWNTRDLEEYFTVVHWDQRGSGRTFLINDLSAEAATMRPERFVADIEELIGWLRVRFGKSKIFLLGHSWGSYVGLRVAQRRPEWLHAYIGVGQAANSPESERRGYAFALDAARRARNRLAVAELEGIAPYAEPGRLIPIEKIMVQRRWLDRFGGVMAYREGQTNGVASRLSPDYTDAEAPRVYDGNEFSQRHLFSTVLSIDLSNVMRLRCPLILLEGRHDRTVNSHVALEWFGRVSAPSKHFVWFEDSGHEVMTEEPGKVLVSLLRYARPLAIKAGDGGQP